MATTAYIKSPLNYIGGKYKIFPQIQPLYPKDINSFIDQYNCFKQLPVNEILEHIEGGIDTFSLSLTDKDGYCAIRELYDEERNTLDLFVLIADSFNHQIRYNSSHRLTTQFENERSSFNNNMKQNRHMKGQTGFLLAANR